MIQQIDRCSLFCAISLRKILIFKGSVLHNGEQINGLRRPNKDV